MFPFFVAHVKALWQKYRKFVPYSSGYVALWTLKPKQAQNDQEVFGGYGGGDYAQREQKDFFHTALLPCDTFLKSFGDSKAFASRLEDRARNVLVEWAVINHGLAPKNRVMSERYYTMYAHNFAGEHKKLSERAEYEMQISSYGYTAAARKVDVPDPIQMRDLKASVLPLPAATA